MTATSICNDIIVTDSLSSLDVPISYGKPRMSKIHESCPKTINMSLCTAHDPHMRADNIIFMQDSHRENLLVTLRSNTVRYYKVLPILCDWLKRNNQRSINIYEAKKFGLFYIRNRGNDWHIGRLFLLFRFIGKYYGDIRDCILNELENDQLAYLGHSISVLRYNKNSISYFKWQQERMILHEICFTKKENSVEHEVYSIYLRFLLYYYQWCDVCFRPYPIDTQSRGHNIGDCQIIVYFRGGIITYYTAYGGFIDMAKKVNVGREDRYRLKVIPTVYNRYCTRCAYKRYRIMSLCQKWQPLESELKIGRGYTYDSNIHPFRYNGQIQVGANARTLDIKPMLHMITSWNSFDSWLEWKEILEDGKDFRFLWRAGPSLFKMQVVIIMLIAKYFTGRPFYICDMIPQMLDWYVLRNNWIGKYLDEGDKLCVPFKAGIHVSYSTDENVGNHKGDMSRFRTPDADGKFPYIVIYNKRYILDSRYNTNIIYYANAHHGTTYKLLTHNLTKLRFDVIEADP